MHCDGSEHFVFVSSTDHLSLIDIFGHHGNFLATYGTKGSSNILYGFTNPKDVRIRVGGWFD